MSTRAGTQGTPPARWLLLLPLALAQFICSFAGSNMNVMLNDMSHDLDTTVQGIQISITLFLLVMAALMIPFGKLTVQLGRKTCFVLAASGLSICTFLASHQTSRPRQRRSRG